MSVGLGPQVWVVVSGADELRRLSMMEEAVSRPDMRTLYEIYSYDRSLGGGRIVQYYHINQSMCIVVLLRAGVIFPDGALWREQRRFVARTLRDLGVGRRTLDDHVLEEARYCLHHLEERARQARRKSFLILMKDSLSLASRSRIPSWRCRTSSTSPASTSSGGWCAAAGSSTTTRGSPG